MNLPPSSRDRRGEDVMSPTSIQVDHASIQAGVDLASIQAGGTPTPLHSSFPPIQIVPQGVITTEVSSDGFYSRTFYPVGYFDDDSARLHRTWRSASSILPDPESGARSLDLTHYDEAAVQLVRSASTRGGRSLLRSVNRIEVTREPEPPITVLSRSQMVLVTNKPSFHFYWTSALPTILASRSLTQRYPFILLLLFRNRSRIFWRLLCYSSPMQRTSRRPAYPPLQRKAR